MVLPITCSSRVVFGVATIPDGVPIDGVPVEEVVTVSLGLTVLYVFLATAGIVFALVCFTFTLIFRNKK